MELIQLLKSSSVTAGVVGGVPKRGVVDGVPKPPGFAKSSGGGSVTDDTGLGEGERLGTGVCEGLGEGERLGTGVCEGLGEGERLGTGVCEGLGEGERLGSCVK